MTRYYFIRHGESTANARGVVAGWSDEPLTDKGIAQAQAAAATIKATAMTFDRIISSPLSRALDTAKIIAEANDYPIKAITIVDALKEKASGTLELQSREVVYDTTEAQMAAAGGEDAAMFCARVKYALDYIHGITSDAESVLIVAHAGIYKAATIIARDEQDPTAIYGEPIPKNATLLDLPICVASYS